MRRVEGQATQGRASGIQTQPRVIAPLHRVVHLIQAVAQVLEHLDHALAPLRRVQGIQQQTPDLEMALTPRLLLQVLVHAEAHGIMLEAVTGLRQYLASIRPTVG